jgi:hypothetical protein
LIREDETLKNELERNAITIDKTKSKIVYDFFTKDLKNYLGKDNFKFQYSKDCEDLGKAIYMYYESKKELSETELQITGTINEK